MGTQTFGIIGMGVMGANLALNIESHGFSVVGYDVNPEQTKKLLQGEGAGRRITGAFSLPDFVAALDVPRRILLMVPAGKPVDDVIAQLLPLVQPGDVIIDGGNSFFMDTERRATELEAHGVHFLGTGISGGEEGARRGPSLMPGGTVEGYTAVKPIFTAMAARASDGQPCVTYVGPRGAGHYVKMVHNGIEYGDMQLIAEAYDILSRGAGFPAAELSAIFHQWNQGELSSYLIGITADILGTRDPETGQPLVDLILDEAQQKGTGKWTSQNALDVGVPIPTINAAVESRLLSAYKHERVAAADVLTGPPGRYSGDRQRLVAMVGDALYASKICSYAQGMALLAAASREYQYNLHLAELARIWRAGCIIRAQFLDRIRLTYEESPDLPNLLLAPEFREAVASRQEAWRGAIKTAIDLGIPCLAMAASLAYYDAYRSARLPANLTQAQRDYFGAHTYRRIDKPGSFHTEWIGQHDPS